MTIKRTDRRFKFMIFFMCLVMVVMSAVPMFTGIDRAEAADGNEITIYFDTSCEGSKSGCTDSSHSNHGWSKTMSKVYYHAYNSSSSTGLKEMTATGLSGSDGGKLFKATISNSYNAIVFSSDSSWHSGSDKLWQTQNYSISTSSSNTIFILNTSGYTDGNYKKQGIYPIGTYEEAVDYHDSPFQITNFTGEEVTFVLTYDNGADKTETQEVTVPAYKLNLDADLTVPSAGTGVTPYQSVSIKRKNDGAVLKKYTFSDKKIPGDLPGNTFAYGVTQYKDESTTLKDETDKKNACFYHARYSSSAVSGLLYFGVSDFPVGASNQPTKTLQIIKQGQESSPIGVNYIAGAGNAKFVTNTTVSFGENEIFTVKYGDDLYHLVWSDSTKNLIELSGDAMNVSGKYSAQSTISNGITINSEFFDYHYDDKYNQDEDITTNEPIEWGYGNQRRPYRTINEKISASAYGQSFSSSTFDKKLSDDSVHNKPPMYIGGFWSSTDNDYYNDDNANDQYSANYDTDKWIDEGIHPLNNFRFGANLAYRPYNQASGDDTIYSTVAQGLVDNQLGGDKESGYELKANGCSVPYFSESWWGDNGISNYVWYKDNIAFPFFTVNSSSTTTLVNGSNNMLTPGNGHTEYSGDYYVFDSQKDVVSIDKNTGVVTSIHNSTNDSDFVWDGYGNGKDKTSQKGIFPFDTPDTPRWKLNMGFGTRFDFDFYLNDAGTLNGEADGVPITFTFQGDDDVWVFLDDQLLLDMGGDHKNALGEINFSTKKIYISQVGYANTNLIEKNTGGNGNPVKVDGKNLSSGTNPTTWTVNNVNFASANSAITADSSYLKSGKHRLTMYYMERGMFNSNLFVMFNLPQDTTHLDVQEDTDFSRVNDAFLSATRTVADNDVFNYTIENKESNNAELSSGYKIPTRENVTRSNSEAAANKDTILATDDGKTTTPVYGLNTNKIFLDVSAVSGWPGDGAKLAAFVYNKNYTQAYLLPLTQVDSTLYYFDYYEDYLEVRFLRMAKNSAFNTSISETFTGANLWSEFENKYPKGDTGYWNRSDSVFIDISSSNTLKITGWDDTGEWLSNDACKSNNNTNTVAGYIDTSVYEPTRNFTSTSSTNYEAVQDTTNNEGVTYKLSDVFASGGTATFNTRSYKGSAKNVLSLQYGQMGTFRKQFTVKSGMRVTQLDDMSQILNGTTKDVKKYGYIDSDNPRKVSTYYDTYAKSESDPEGIIYRQLYAGIYNGDDVVNTGMAHIEDMYGNKTTSGDAITYSIKTENPNYSNSNVALGISKDNNKNTVTTYNFIDPSDSTNQNVHLRQVIVNAVKTYDLTITKNVVGVSGTISDEFEFTVSFSNVFGSNLGDDYINLNAAKIYLDGGLSHFKSVSDDGKTGTFKLTNGQKLVIKGIPVGTSYTVTETNSGDDYVQDIDNSVDTSGDSVTSSKTALITNKRKVGDLEFVGYAYLTEEKAAADTAYTTETVDDRLNDSRVTEADFKVKVTINVPENVDLNYFVETNDTKEDGAEDAPDKWTKGDGNTYTLTFSPYKLNNVVSSMRGLPFGTGYTVVQTDTAYGFTQYDTSIYTNGNNNIKAMSNEAYRIDHETTTTDPADRVILKNILPPIVMPETGGTPLIFLLPYGIIAIAVSGVALVIYKKKLQGASLYVKRKGRSD